MRWIAGLVLAGALSGCLGFSAGPPDTSSQSGLDRDAEAYCSKEPNTDDMLACRRDKQDSWRDPSPAEKISLPGKL